MAKEFKTSAELKALLDEGIRRFSIGCEPNAQWIRIICVDPPEEGANWKVAHGGPSGAFADAIGRVMRELQKAYDLSPSK